MRLIITLLLTLTWKIHHVENETCGKPEVGRELWHIYRVIEAINVSVHNCFYTHTLHKYSDVTENCIRAFHTDIYMDKWNDMYAVTESSPVRINSYNAKADVIQNEIILKSGTTCRYDRGFCYDPKESIDYAVVWEVIDKGLNVEDKNLEQIFYGWLDTWTLNKNSLKYLVFQDSRTDRSFGLQLAKKASIRGTDFWYTEQYGIVASQNTLKTSIKSTPRLNQKYLPLKPKQFTSEHILRDCDLERFPLDFARKINENYLSDLNNLKDILALLQEQILKVRTNSGVKGTGYKENPATSNDIAQLKNNIRDIQALLLVKDKEVSQLQSTLTNTQNVLLAKNQDITGFEEKIKNILSQRESLNAELDKLRASFTALQNKISNLENDRNSKKTQEITNLENILSELRTKLLRNDEDIFATLNQTNKDIKGVANNLGNIYSQLQHKEEQLKKENDNIKGRINDLEVDSGKHTKDIAKCQNDIKAILAETEKGFLEAQKRLQEKVNEVSAKLNLHDGQISKCQNYTDFLRTSGNSLLEAVKRDVRNIQNAVFRNEIKIMDLENENANITQDNTELDSKIDQLRENFRIQNEQVLSKLAANQNGINEIREKSDTCQEKLKKSLTEKNEEYEEIQNNFTEIQAAVSAKGEEIVNLQKKIKESNSNLALIEKKCSGEISSLQDYTKSKLNDQNVEIKGLRHILSEKDKEIKELQASMKDLQGKNGYLFDKIDKCQKDTDAKLKQKDAAITRIENDIKKREDAIRKEIKDRDVKYDKLVKEIEHIKENTGTVDAV